MAIDVYTTVTDSIIKALEAGTAPWVKPWQAKGSNGLPFNAVSKRPYSGTNVLLLFMAGGAKAYGSDGWLTYRQAQEAGGFVRRGERGTQIVFAKQIVKTSFDDAGQEVEERIPLLRMFTVFNVEQCEGLPESITGKPEEVPEENRSALVDSFIRRIGADIRHGGDRACYIPSVDSIRMPYSVRFTTQEEYYATLLHECGHWTGSEKRLNRQFGKRFGDEAYAFEELVAEMTAAFTCARLSVQGRLQHAEYISSWLSVLKGDKKAIFTAASAATKASEFLFDLAGDYASDAVQPDPVPPVPPKGKGKAKAKRKSKAKGKPAKPVRVPVSPSVPSLPSLPAYNRKWDYVSPELSADYRRSVKDRLRSDSQGNVGSFDYEVLEYSRVIMANRGHVMADRYGTFDADKRTVTWRGQHGGKPVGPKALVHHLPEHVFGWSPTVTHEETLADGTVKRFELIGEGRKAKWVDVTRMRIRRPDPVSVPVAAE